MSYHANPFRCTHCVHHNIPFPVRTSHATNPAPPNIYRMRLASHHLPLKSSTAPSPDSQSDMQHMQNPKPYPSSSLTLYMNLGPRDPLYRHGNEWRLCLLRFCRWPRLCKLRGGWRTTNCEKTGGDSVMMCAYTDGGQDRIDLFDPTKSVGGGREHLKAISSPFFFFCFLCQLLAPTLLLLLYRYSPLSATQ